MSGKKSVFSDFHPVKASPGFGDPMGNHAPEACMAQANSQIGGAIRRLPKRKSLFRLGSSLRARRHRVRPNVDREWYHIMALIASYMIHSSMSFTEGTS